jgi:hypothetical protein
MAVMAHHADHLDIADNTCPETRASGNNKNTSGGGGWALPDAPEAWPAGAPAASASALASGAEVTVSTVGGAWRVAHTLAMCQESDAAKAAKEVTRGA